MTETNQQDIKHHDLAIIGGGPAGYAAALYGASAGLDVAIVEMRKLGGTCLNVGCIPAKEFLESAAVFQTVLSAKEFGTEIDGVPTINMAEVQARKQQVVEKLVKGLSGTLKSRGITVYSGVGTLAPNESSDPEKSGAPKKVLIKNTESTATTENSKKSKPSTTQNPSTQETSTQETSTQETSAQEITADHILLATGSKPRQLPESTGLKVDGKTVVTSDEILSWDEKPESVAIVGAGAIGVEFASFFSDIGSEVMLVEALDEILAGVDPDISKVVERSFSKRGIKIATGVSVTSYEEGVLKFADNKAGDKKDESGEFKTELVIVCVGRRPNSDSLKETALNVGIEIDDAGFVKVDENLLAGENIYAAGDLINSPQLAHIGFAEGIFVVKHLLGEDPLPIDYEKVPWGIYCQPEIAFAGLTERAAADAGYEVAVSKHSFAANGRAQILGETDGLVKVVAEKETGKLLGVHMVGPWVTEQLGAGYLAINWEASAGEIADFIFPHPTLSEMFGEAAISLTGRSLHA